MSTIMTSAAAKGIAFRMASTIPRPTAAVCSWELPTKLPPSPFPALEPGAASGSKNFRQLCEGLGPSVTVSHYSSGASKMESHSPVQPDRRKLASRALDTYEKASRFQSAISRDSLSAEARPAKMELHDLTPDGN